VKAAGLDVEENSGGMSDDAQLVERMAKVDVCVSFVAIRNASPSI
jgi:hypothetical protein